MSFSAPPASAAWRHRDARDGFEVVFFRETPGGYLVEGHTAAVEEGEAWAVEYSIDLDPRWTTRRALVRGRSGAGLREVALEADGRGGWAVDGTAAPHLDGCLDVDLESSSFTNALPVRRLGLAIGGRADAPAAYVRALDLGVERLEQDYVRREDDEGRERYDYRSPAFDFECVLVYDASGLVLDYPGIATRVA
jgi:hypothetical protein